MWPNLQNLILSKLSTFIYFYFNNNNISFMNTTQFDSQVPVYIFSPTNVKN